MDDNEWKCEKKIRKGWEKDENEKDENEKLNQLPDQLETWNLDYSSEVDDNEWKWEKKRKKKKNEKGREKDEEKEKDENKNWTNFSMS